jgi:hypothetical protein
LKLKHLCRKSIVLKADEKVKSDAQIIIARAAIETDDEAVKAAAYAKVMASAVKAILKLCITTHSFQK